MYFHSKGITHFTTYYDSQCFLQGPRTHNCEQIIKDINLIYEIFTIFPSIDKITATCGGIGWGWYNYWIARGSYLCQVEKPIITKRRHYYEDWLGRKLLNVSLLNNDSSLYENTLKNCYQLYCNEHSGNIGFKMVVQETNGICSTDLIEQHL